MRYPTGETLAQEVLWFEKHYCPAFQEAVNNLHRAQNGKFLKRKFIIRRGEKLAEWFRKAISVEKQSRGIELHQPKN